MKVPRIKMLLGEDYKESVSVEQCEFPEIFAVHFRLLDFLAGGAACSSRIDMLGGMLPSTCGASLSMSLRNFLAIRFHWVREEHLDWVKEPCNTRKHRPFEYRRFVFH